MRRWIADMNPLLRGFLIILAIVAVIYVLQLERTLTALFLLARIAFFLAIAYFLYMLWRDRREEIASWSVRSRIVFYGAALLMVVNVAARFFYSAGSGLDLLAFLLVFPLAGFAMWRVWRDEHTYTY
jgi:fucose 4-O-acetylase-like acetyltransferase